VLERTGLSKQSGRDKEKVGDQRDQQHAFGDHEQTSAQETIYIGI
jgi:hypothetical protein